MNDKPCKTNWSWKIKRLKVKKDIIGKCPNYGKNVYESEKSFYCEWFKYEPKCTFSIIENNKLFTYKGKNIPKIIVKSLLLKGKVNVKILKKKDNSSTYGATVIMSLNEGYVNLKLNFNNKNNIFYYGIYYETFNRKKLIIKKNCVLKGVVLCTFCVLFCVLKSVAKSIFLYPWFYILSLENC